MTSPKSSKAPTGLLGFQWGDDAAEVARTVGLTVERWDAWTNPAFETAIDFDHPRQVLNVEGLVRLVRGGAAIEGVQMVYRDCAPGSVKQRELRARLRSELNVKAPEEEVPYQVWDDGSLVHMKSDRTDATCTLTVAGPKFGRAFADAVLSGGMQELGNGLTPH